MPFTCDLHFLRARESIDHVDRATNLHPGRTEEPRRGHARCWEVHARGGVSVCLRGGRPRSSLVLRGSQGAAPQILHAWRRSALHSSRGRLIRGCMDGRLRSALHSTRGRARPARAGSSKRKRTRRRHQCHPRHHHRRPLLMPRRPVTRSPLLIIIVITPLSIIMLMMLVAVTQTTTPRRRLGLLTGRRER